MKEWHCVLYGQPQGPFTEEQLKEMIGRGEIARDTLVWSGSTQADAARGWVKASETELVSLFSPGASAQRVEPSLPPMPSKLSFSDEETAPEKREAAPTREEAPAEKEGALQDEAAREKDPDSYSMERLPSAMFMQAGGAQNAQATQSPQDEGALPEAEPTPQTQSPAAPVPASRIMRFCGFVLECVLSSILSALYLPAVILAARGSITAGIGAMGLASLVLLAYCIFNLVCLYRSGQTIAKKMVGIRIVNVDGSRTPLWKIIVLRYGIYFILSIVVNVLRNVPLVGSLAAGLFSIFFLVDSCFIFRGDRRTIHDHVAGTIVVKE